MPISPFILSKREKILQLAMAHGARHVRIFGSVSRGEDKPESDVDLLVELEPRRSLLDRIGLMQDLQELLNRKVDVVNEKSLHWYVKDKILKEAIPL